jgi:5-methylcytosine-specific restriction endonuclease McrA
MTDFLDEEKVESWLRKRDNQRAKTARYQAKYPERVRATVEKRHARPDWKETQHAYQQKYLSADGVREARCAHVKAKYHALTDAEKTEFNRLKRQQLLKKDPEHFKKRWVTHKESEYAKSARWRQRNPDRMRLYEANRRAKAALNGGEFSPDIIEKLTKTQKGKCNGCGVKLTKQNCCLDHIQPISKGGKSVDSNAQLLCRSCNSSKRDKEPHVFMRSRGFLL